MYRPLHRCIHTDRLVCGVWYSIKLVVVAVVVCCGLWPAVDEASIVLYLLWYGTVLELLSILKYLSYWVMLLVVMMMVMVVHHRHHRISKLARH